MVDAVMRERIRSGIAGRGHHVTLVQGGSAPRFAYSIGLTDRVGVEVVLAGAASLTAKAVKRVIDAVAALVADGAGAGATVDLDDGSFRLGGVDKSWAEKLLLGVADYYYSAVDVAALQVIPELALRTVDVPDLARPWDPAGEPVWQWLGEAWTLGVPSTSVAVTDLGALHGEPVTEAARWEETEWEMFAGAGPDIPRERVKVVPLSTMVGFDKVLMPVVGLEVGDALRREPSGAWERWG